MRSVEQHSNTKPKTKMKNQITEQTLLIDAINGLRCAGQDKFADYLSEKLEEIAVEPKIAIYVNGGSVEAVRSNIAEDLEVEIVDNDCFQVFERKSWNGEAEDAEDRWEELQNELPFGNY